jgi:hypothetical protein
MVDEKKISNIENNILNEEAVIHKEDIKIQEISKEISGSKHSNSGNGSFIEKSLIWLKNPYNLALVGIIIFAVVIRFYYFWITKNQPLWWDESEYMSKAKAIAGLVNYNASAIRSPVFPAFMSIFFFLNITSEPVMRFFGLFIPSILVIVLTYFMIREMYPDKRIALVSTLIIAVLWEHLFYSNRFQTENIALIFQFLAIFLFFRCYLRKKDFYFIKAKYSLIWVITLSILSFLFRPGNIMFIPALFLFFLILNKDKVFTKTGLSSILILFFAVTASVLVSEKLMAFVNQYVFLSEPLGWHSLTVFYGFYQSFVPNLPPLFFYAFLIGAVVVLFRTILILDSIKTLEVDSENLEFKSDLFNIILILSVLFLFIFIMRANSFEYRWFFPFLPAMLALTAKGIIISSDYLAGFSGKKSLAVILIIIISLLGVYSQVYHADQIIKNKLDSYSQVRDAALWLKGNYPSNTKVLSVSYPQTVYYSELNISTYSTIPAIPNESAFNEFLNQTGAKLLEVSVFEQHPGWINDWLEANSNNTSIQPIKIYYADVKKQTPVLIIYDLSY